MRKLIAAIGVILVLGSGAVLTGAVAFGSNQTRTRPDSATGTGTDWIPVLGGSTFVVGGTVHSQLFGRGTFVGQGTQTGPTAFNVTTVTIYKVGTLTQYGSGTDTGANTSTVQNTIVSGTGRFAGATGSSTTMSTTSPAPDPAIRSLRFTLTGTITLAAGTS